MSDQRPLARAACEGLCIFLPHNLAASTTCFANLVLASPQLEEEGPQLRVSAGPSYSFLCPHPSASCSCSLASTSCLVTRLSRILSSPLPPEVLEMVVRTEVERVLLLARVAGHLDQQKQKVFLKKNGLEPGDLDILTFFHMFS